MWRKIYGWMHNIVSSLISLNWCSFKKKYVHDFKIIPLYLIQKIVFFILDEPLNLESASIGKFSPPPFPPLLNWLSGSPTLPAHKMYVYNQWTVILTCVYFHNLHSVVFICLYLAVFSLFFIIFFACLFVVFFLSFSWLSIPCGQVEMEHSRPTESGTQPSQARKQLYLNPPPRFVQRLWRLPRWNWDSPQGPSLPRLSTARSPLPGFKITFCIFCIKVCSV